MVQYTVLVQRFTLSPKIALMPYSDVLLVGRSTILCLASAAEKSHCKYIDMLIGNPRHYLDLTLIL
jgi:hypothetical protein